MADTGSTANTTGGAGPGFLTPTPPAGGGASGPLTPPPGQLGPASTPTARPSPTATAQPTAAAPSVAGRASGTPTASPTATPYETPTPEATDTPVPVANVLPANYIQVEMPTPAAVLPGGTAMIQSTTTIPGAICTLTVRYRTAASAIPQFPALAADANGMVSWSWQVAADVVAGDWPVTVRCQVGLPLNDPNLPYAYATKLLPVR